MKNRSVSTSRRPPENMQQTRIVNPQRQPQYNPKQAPVKQIERPKISISDAIGLTTIRLSRIEQIIDKLHGTNTDSESFVNQFSDNVNNSDVFEIINTRLNNIEQIINNNKLNERLIKCENDLTDTKGLLIQLVLKHEKLSTDLNLKLADVLQNVNSHETYILEQQSKSYISENSQTDNLEIESLQPELLQNDVLEN
jgi:hypothetical protein